MDFKILYIENTDDGRQVFSHWTSDKYDLTIVEDLIDLDERLYDMGGYEEYDALVIDLALEMSPGIAMEDLESEIPGFSGIDYTQVGGGITLLGFDYFKHVVNIREETEKMVAEGRVILFTGHAKIIKRDNKYTEDKFPTTPLIDRSDPNWTDLLEQIFNRLKNKKHSAD